jgi:uncharacterized delta-60 repeat protein
MHIHHSSRLILFSFIVLVLTLTSISRTVVEAAAGGLDLSFGNGGKVTLDFGETSPNGTFFPTRDEVSDMALQADGKVIVVGGTFGFFTGGGGAVVRYNANGSLDTTFGSGGKVIRSGVGFSAVAIQRDGRIVTAGGNGLDFIAARYNTDGSPDTTFGTNGLVIVALVPRGYALYATGQDVGVQPDGKIVILGYVSKGSDNDYDFALVRLNSDGSLDTTFGVDGKVTTDFTPLRVPPFVRSEDWAFSLAIQNDGKIVAAGTGNDGRGYYYFALARYRTDGSLDPAFGMGGRILMDPSGPGTIIPGGQISGIAVQSDGRIVAVGYSGGPMPFPNTYITITRFNGDGTLDMHFGTGGVIKEAFGSSFNMGQAVAIQRNGKIVVVGASSSIDSFPVGAIAIARYQIDGTLDLSFGNGGKVFVGFGQNNVDETGMKSVTIQPDGKILMAGTSRNIHTGEDFALLRIFGDPVGPDFDYCLQDDSSGNLLQINTETWEYQFTNCAGLTIGGTGILTKRGSLITLQHNGSDRRVMATIDTSTNKATASVQLFSQGRTFTITDRNITNNTCACK